MKPFTGLPDDVASEVVDAVKDIVEDRYVTKFFIGRTNDTERKRSELGADDVVPVYKTIDSDNAIDIVGALLDVLREDPRCDNDVENGSDEDSSEGVQYVYIAVWLAE
jgi:hypothetical protein